MSARDGAFRISGRCPPNRADLTRLVGRIHERQGLATSGLAVDQCRRLPRLRGRRFARGFDRAQLSAIRKVHAGRVQPIGAVDARRIDDARMRHFGVRIHLRDRVRHHGFGGQTRIDDAIHERCIRAVLQQPAHEVWQQVFMRPDRRVDAAGVAALIRRDDLRIQLFAHAMEALILERARSVAEHLRNERDRLRVVGGELRVDDVLRGGEESRAREVRRVRCSACA